MTPGEHAKFKNQIDQVYLRDVQKARNQFARELRALRFVYQLSRKKENQNEHKRNTR